jgi:hypothetical protein
MHNQLSCCQRGIDFVRVRRQLFNFRITDLKIPQKNVMTSGKSVNSEQKHRKQRNRKATE